jgi:hypothetical protein
MSKRHSRVFSVILAAALTLTMLPPLAFAEGDPQGAAPAPDDAASLGLMALAGLLAAAGTSLVARRGQPQRRNIYRSGTRQGR